MVDPKFEKLMADLRGWLDAQTPAELWASYEESLRRCRENDMLANPEPEGNYQNTAAFTLPNEAIAHGAVEVRIFELTPMAQEPLIAPDSSNITSLTFCLC